MNQSPWLAAALAAALALSPAARAADPPTPPRVTVHPVWVPSLKEWRFELVVQDFGISSFHVGKPPAAAGKLTWFLNLLENDDWSFDGDDLLGDQGWNWQLNRVADDANVFGDMTFSLRAAGNLGAVAPADWQFRFDYVWTDQDTQKLTRTFFALDPGGLGPGLILRSEPALQSVPEPGTAALAALGMFTLLLVRRSAAAARLNLPKN